MPNLSHRACLLALVALLASASLTACAAWGPAARGDTDAPAPDASEPFGDVGPVGLGVDVGTSAPFDEATGDSSGGRSSCLDFVDNDVDGVLDCDEPACRSLTTNSACCVGSTATDCCVDVAPVLVAPLATCTGGAECLGVDGVELTATLGQVFDGAAVAGACAVPSPAVFAPIGSTGGASHGVMVLPTALSTETSYLTVEGRLGAADVSDVRVSAAGFGLFRPQDLGVLARPLVAVITSATADEVRVVVGDRVIATAPYGAEPCDRSAEYQLSTSPDGRFEVRRRAAGAIEWEPTFADGTFDGGNDLRVAMFGQQPNPTSAPTAWVADLEVNERACDVLAPAREASVVAGDRDHDVTGIAVFPRDTTGDAWEALVTAGDQIHWMAVQRTSGGLVSSTPAVPFADNIQPAAWPAGYQHVEDIEVFRDGGGTLRVLLAAAPTADAPTVIVATTYTPSPTLGRPGTLDTLLREVVSASAFPTLPLGGAPAVTPVSVDGPTARRVDALASTLFLARVRYSDGHSEIRVVPSQPDNAAGFESADPGAAGRDADGVTTNGLVHASQPRDASAFDRDEVADPQVVEIGGVVRVLYAGRRGTRWSIGTIVASPAVSHFIPVSSEPQLSPTGTGFDALGVSEPQLVLRAGTQWLYFAGSDGARRGIGVAHQALVTESSP